MLTRLVLRNVTLKTKLLVIMASQLVLSVSALFVLHLLGQRSLLTQVREYTEGLSLALEVAQEQPAAQGDPDAVVRAYAEKLRRLGVEDVSIVDEQTGQVYASTDPGIVGKTLPKKGRRRGPAGYVIRGVLGDESAAPGLQRTSSFTIPIVVNDRRVGAVVITRYLDDFSELARKWLRLQLATTLVVAAVGILLSLYLSWSFSRPLRELSQAAGQVAAGDLTVQVPAGGRDEVGSLSGTFNEMVERLREKRQLEERLHFAERSTAVGRLASAMAHEIRNPLNLINLSIDHVRERLQPAEAEQREQFDRILGNVKTEISRLNRLVGDFLAFGKPMRPDRRSCAVERVVQDVAALVAPKARDQRVNLDVRAEPELPPLLADPELLRTCVLNLLINALDAMPQGGNLTVSVGRAADAGGEQVEIVVADDGQGMTPEAAQAAFEPYFSTKETGLGLGLALTHKIVTDHAGSIALESEPGRGTRVNIRLPVLPAALAAAPA